MNLFDGVDKFSLGGITQFINKLITLGLDLVGIVCIIFIIISGITFITSGGNKEQSEKGKKGLTWAIVGLILVLSAKYIVPFFESLIKK